MSIQETQEVEVQNSPEEHSEKLSHCFACGEILRHYSLLICAECLDDNSDQFLKMAEIYADEEILAAQG